MKIGERIRRERLNLNMSINHLAKLTALNKRTIMALELENKCKLDTLNLIAEKLGLKIKIQCTKK